MTWETADLNGAPQGRFKIAEIRKLQHLESGSYWSELYPYFSQTDYQRLRYAIQGKTRDTLVRDHTVAVRAASQAGELDVAFIADRVSATMSIKDPGLPDYCLTVVEQGQLVYRGAARTHDVVTENVGLIYRGRPGTELAASGQHKRLAIWIPQASVTQRLVALLGTAVPGDTEFMPTFDWNRHGSQALRHIVAFMMAELQAPAPTILGSETANRAFTDLLIYTLLRSLPHTFAQQLEGPVRCAAPKTLQRAEAYIRAHVEDPIAIHDVAAAAGCSLRSLQLAFRNFRETTPLLAVRQARLEAARDAMRLRDAGAATVTEIAQRFGFANAGRFTRLYKSSFGEPPVEVLRRGRGRTETTAK
jgi:AraC-like DNA-binding protein